jgi:hypothetical protein
MSSLLQLLFGCPHKHYTFPISARPGQRRPAAAGLTGPYVVCLDCAQEFPYDWREMKILSPRSRKAAAECPAQVAGRAA